VKKPKLDHETRTLTLKSFFLGPGGGKSLCYQLPALVSPGITLVISPLLSLIRDQAFHLDEASIGVGMLTSYTTKEESKRIMDAMLGPVPAKGTPKKQSQPTQEQDDGHPPLKLVYVTPEKVSKSKRFMNQLEKVSSNGRLSRIVVDECHCCSNQGHDFRPDYNVSKPPNSRRNIFLRALSDSSMAPFLFFV